jgi:hypothetical protein
MRRSLYLLTLISAFLPSFSFAADPCSFLKNSRALIPDPQNYISVSDFKTHSDLNKMSIGFYLYSWKQAEFLCSLTHNSELCLRKSATILDQALTCLEPNLTVKEVKPMTWAYLRNQEVQSLVLDSIYHKSSSQEELQLQKNLWSKYQVLLLPGKISTPRGLTQSWRIEDLHRIEQSYEKLRQAVSNSVSEKRVFEFSHLWGAGTALARLGYKTISGQFGEMEATSPLQISVVVDVLKENKPAELLAQQIAHENSHSHDYLRGLLMTGDYIDWSETNAAQIFEMCGLKPSYEVELYDCRNKNPTWFNFHPTAYPAIRSAEFYTKMLDEWVRENLNLVPKGRYRCQNKETLNFWLEMEKNLIGEVTSSDCDIAN